MPSHGWAREHQEEAGEQNMREAWRWRRDAASLTCAHARTHTANGIESLMLQGSGRRGRVSRSCHLFPPISRCPGGFPLYFPHPLLASVSVAISNREAQEGKGRAMRTWGGAPGKVYGVAGLTRTSSKVTASVLSLGSASRRQLREASRPPRQAMSRTR